MADVIGVISGGMGIYSFIESLLPSAESLKTTVRVSAGKISETAGGKVAEIRLYDDAGSIVGKNEGGGVDRGSFTDISISQSTGQQATWVELRGDDDAICIPYISVTWADGSTYGWMGDVAKECGMDWYEGGVYVSFLLLLKTQFGWILTRRISRLTMGASKFCWSLFLYSKANSCV